MSQQETTEITPFNFSLKSSDNKDSFTYEYNSTLDDLVTVLWSISQDDLFVREALKVVGDFINEKYYNDEQDG